MWVRVPEEELISQRRVPSAFIGLFSESVLLGAEHNGMYILLDPRNSQREVLPRPFRWRLKVRAGIFRLVSLSPSRNEKSYGLEDSGGKLGAEDMERGSGSPPANTFKHRHLRSLRPFHLSWPSRWLWRHIFMIEYKLILFDSLLACFKSFNNLFMIIHFYSKCRAWMKPVFNTGKLLTYILISYILSKWLLIQETDIFKYSIFQVPAVIIAQNEFFKWKTHNLYHEFIILNEVLTFERIQFEVWITLLRNRGSGVISISRLVLM